MKKRDAPETQTYPRDALIRSKRFAWVQRDFLAAILTEEIYTMEAAEKAVADFFGGGKIGS